MFDCIDCRTSTFAEYYMIHDDLWAAAGLGRWDGMLCVGCLERRIGRELTAADFTDALVNTDSARRSPRLIDRLNPKVEAA